MAVDERRVTASNSYQTKGSSPHPVISNISSAVRGKLVAQEFNSDEPLTFSHLRPILYQTVGTAEERMGVTSKGEKTRARVLEAARQLINEKGFRSTSVNDIIRVTGVKKGNLYFHFADKEELGVAVLEQAHRDFMVFLGRSLKGERPLERLSSLLDVVLEKQRKTKFVGG